ncbi:S1C family serine protease [Tuwongella immobilis]|uniref:PDZ domain-containing protein n=1 Tax=Tuwongella immobilis TaxID=692036 RepID=A0A6C2YRA6_9BACT|nr:trypsin-like peptidase domain-containing protein [Tuwongella immobilis]VIP03887.1 periplasmic serine proteinase do : Periplasmic serine proteinase DO OS=uncultured planctomycete GN=HGMM_F01A04C11 PE=4 SV=1: Trypsin_2: PDZ_2 [Tuwongella immobilis]VTS05141.1 periplasmic serine proteinase do : Periplasmic serine proteinase DO OS=uncultured planctomycete GN=HGMM_F01A04C11 PE=4 SV=1: Trypsin_2: PDZ_2 [Tuwongella immobilis]
MKPFSRMTFSRRIWLAGLSCVGSLALIGAPASMLADDAQVVKSAEQQRIDVINKVRPSVVAIFDPAGQGGGSGVIIDPEGYALTNFHVVGQNRFVRCGLPDGILYDGVVVGLDRVGDVALVKLLPKKEGDKFPFSPMGDSDKLKPGEWSLAMGNPFLLATDFTPTVTFGLISGVNRYQYPSGSFLEYTDCIQFDTSINPGNSGGPLYNMQGELVGINGRGSFDKRSRINSGVGYAISINQIKNFLGHMYAGIDTDHATLGATVSTDEDDSAIPRMVIQQMLEDSDIARRGILPEDELVSFAGRPISSTNQYKNILGIYPKGWRLPMVVRRNEERRETLVRLMGLLPSERPQPMQPGRPQPAPGRPQPGQPMAPTKPQPESPAAKYFKAKPGFANYYFNEVQQQKLLAAFAKFGDFSQKTGAWTATGKYQMADRAGNLKFRIGEGNKMAGDAGTTQVSLSMNFDSQLDPLKPGLTSKDLQEPINSGGLMVALYHYRRLLTMGAKGFEGKFAHGGHEPFYPMPLTGDAPKNLRDLRIDTEVLLTEHGAVDGKWYFDRKDGKLLGFEIFVSDDDDPCEVFLHDYKPVNGVQLPHTLEVRYRDSRYAVLTISDYQLAEAAK